MHFVHYRQISRILPWKLYIETNIKVNKPHHTHTTLQEKNEFNFLAYNTSIGTK